MRFSLAVAVVVVSLGVSGLAQQNKPFKVKHSPPEKTPKSSVPIGKTAGPAASSSANAKDLQTLERQTAKTSAPARSAAKKTPAKAPAKSSALKPVKDKPNPPINFSGASGGKTRGTNAAQSSNPYRGRLRQKHSRQ